MTETPEKTDRDVFDEFMVKYAELHSIVKAAKAIGTSSRTIYRIFNDQKTWRTEFDVLKEVATLDKVEEIEDFLDRSALGKTDITRAQVACAAIRLKALDPKRYYERLAITGEDSTGKPAPIAIVEVRLSDGSRETSATLQTRDHSKGRKSKANP